jgi:Na+/H+ antiporter NhaA
MTQRESTAARHQARDKDAIPQAAIGRGPIAERSQRTQWTRSVAPALPTFLRTEAGSAGVLVVAIAAALIWSNVDPASYESLWRTSVSLHVGDLSVSRDLRTWINSGLMTLFFLVVGLEARREIDLGDLRDRRRLVLPVVAGVAGMVLPAGIYLAVTAGSSAMHGWGAAMSSDTALAMGLLAVVGRTVPRQVRAFLLTVFVVDDVVALVVIGVAYSAGVALLPLGVAAVAFAIFVGGLAIRVDLPPIYVLLGVVMWAAVLASGIDPVVTGLAIGLVAWAYSPTRGDLEQATGLFRLFREQPTPELARTATTGLISTLSPNSRLQRVYHSWTSYVIVPLFALANAGLEIDAGVLAHAYTAPVTLGILIGTVVGKPIGIVGASWLISQVSGRRLRPTVGWATVVGSGTIAGIGFTVSLLIATLAFNGQSLIEAKLGILSAAVAASVLTWAVFRLTSLLSPARRALALHGDAQRLVDLVPPANSEYDHTRGPDSASVTVVEYGDFECPYCGRAESAVRDLLVDAQVRFVWRHLPLTDVHPHAQLAAEAAEAAATQDAFWPMHDLLLSRQENLGIEDLLRYADELGLDRTRFSRDLQQHAQAARIAQDVESADLSGVSGTPTFFVNGQRYYGAYDTKSLAAAIETATRVSATIRSCNCSSMGPRRVIPSRVRAASSGRPASDSSVTPTSSGTSCGSRTANTIPTDSAWSRRATNASTWADAWSSHCASSTTHTSGRSRAISATRPSTASPTRNRSGDRPALNPNDVCRASCCGSGNRSVRSKNGAHTWCNPAKASSCSDCTPAACTTREPRACPAKYSSNAVLPAPASPRTTSARLSPTRTAASSRSSVSRSSTRSNSTGASHLPTNASTISRDACRGESRALPGHRSAVVAQRRNAVGTALRVY